MLSADLFVLLNGQWIRIEYQDVILIQANHNYCLIITEKRTYRHEITLTRLMEIVHPGFYQQVHRSYAIPLHRIRSLSNETVNLGSREVAIGKSFLAELLARLPILK